MEEEFPLDIELTGIIKHISLGIVVTWIDSDCPQCDEDEKIQSSLEEDKNIGQKIVLQDGIIEWMDQTLEKPVGFKFSFFNDDDGPLLIFGSEGDRALFVLKWM